MEIEDLEEEYKKLQQEGLKLSLEELDKIFLIKEYILKEGFVEGKLSRAISSRIVEALNEWNNYLHSLIMPDTSNIINITESQLFTEDEKDEIIRVMNKILSYTTLHIRLSITRNLKDEIDFINRSVEVWNEIQPKLISFVDKIKDYWDSEAKKKSTQLRKHNEDFI